MSMDTTNISSTAVARFYEAARKASEAIGSVDAPEKAAAPSGPSFSDTLAEVAEETRARIGEAERVSIKGLTGQAGPQEVAQALAEAEMALETVTVVRDKVVEAYQEILRMPV